MFNPESNVADVTDAEAGRGVPTIAHVAQYLADMIVTWDTGMSRKGPLPASLIEQSLTRFFGSALVPTPDAGKAEGNAAVARFEFDRYVNGVLMAEGVTIERAPDLEKAMRSAAKIASRGPNREVPVLVLRLPPANGEGR